MALPFFIPFILARINTKILLFTFAPLAILSLIVYLAASVYYNWTVRHPFDPFLQSPLPLIQDINAPKDAGTFRILCLGGSTTQSDDLAPEDRYPAVLQAILEKEYPSRKFEVFNAGQAFYTTKHSLIGYATYYRRWKPDLILILHGINDLYRSFSPPDYALGEYDDLWRHFYGSAINGARPVPFEKHLWRQLMTLQIGPFPLKNIPDAWYSILRSRAVDYPAERYAAFGPFQKYLDALTDIAQKDGAAVMLLTQPSLYKPVLSPAEEKALRFGSEVCSTLRWGIVLEYANHTSVGRALERFNAGTLQVAESGKLPVLDAAALIPRDLQHFWDDVHYTRAGARLLGELAAKKISELKLIPGETNVPEADVPDAAAA